MNGLVNEEDLKDWTGEKTRPRLEQWLDSRGISYYIGKNGRICRTLEAINNNLTDGVLSFEKATG